MKIKPLNGYVLVKVGKAPETTKSGLIITPKDDGKLEEAEVLEVPMVTDLRENTLRKGDRVIFKSYNLDAVEIRGETLNFIKEDDIMAVL